MSRTCDIAGLSWSSKWSEGCKTKLKEMKESLKKEDELDKYMMGRTDNVLAGRSLTFCSIADTEVVDF